MADRLKDLIDAALAARDSAYAPYSNHPVGAAILSYEGGLYVGCNVENAAYPLGLCAEAGAISAMVLAGDRTIEHVVIVGPGDAPCTPCGGCRQKIREFSDAAGAVVTVCDREGQVLLTTTDAELLPYSFGPDNVQEMQD